MGPDGRAYRWGAIRLARAVWVWAEWSAARQGGCVSGGGGGEEGIVSQRRKGSWIVEMSSRVGGVGGGATRSSGGAVGEGGNPARSDMRWRAGGDGWGSPIKRGRGVEMSARRGGGEAVERVSVWRGLHAGLHAGLGLLEGSRGGDDEARSRDTSLNASVGSRRLDDSTGAWEEMRGRIVSEVVTC